MSVVIAGLFWLAAVIAVGVTWHTAQSARCAIARLVSDMEAEERCYGIPPALRPIRRFAGQKPARARSAPTVKDTRAGFPRKAA